MSRAFCGGCVVLVLLAAAGWAQDPPAEAGGSKSGAMTPLDAVKQFVEGAKQRDKAAMLKVLDADAGEQALFGAILDLAAAGEEFKKKMIEKYTEKGWDEFNDKDGANLNTSFNVVEDVGKIKIEGGGEGEDTAKATIPGEENPLVLIKKDDRWYIDATETISLTGGTDAKDVAAKMEKFVAILKESMSLIGAEGKTPEDIDQEVGRKFLEVLLGS